MKTTTLPTATIKDWVDLRLIPYLQTRVNDNAYLAKDNWSVQIESLPFDIHVYRLRSYSVTRIVEQLRQDKVTLCYVERSTGDMYRIPNSKRRLLPNRGLDGRRQKVGSIYEERLFEFLNENGLRLPNRSLKAINSAARYPLDYMDDYIDRAKRRPPEDAESNSSCLNLEALRVLFATTYPNNKNKYGPGTMLKRLIGKGVLPEGTTVV